MLSLCSCCGSVSICHVPIITETKFCFGRHCTHNAWGANEICSDSVQGGWKAGPALCSLLQSSFMSGACDSESWSSTHLLCLVQDQAVAVFPYSCSAGQQAIQVDMSDTRRRSCQTQAQRVLKRPGPSGQERKNAAVHAACLGWFYLKVTGGNCHNSNTHTHPGSCCSFCLQLP